MTRKADTHPSPAWLAQGDCVLPVRLEFKSDPSWHWVEALWCRRLGARCYELCCIPFFAYNLALGDQLEVEPDADGLYRILGVRKTSGHSTYRAWFHAAADRAIRDELKQALTELNCLTEWLAADLVAIDAAPDVQVQAVSSLLCQWQQHGRLHFEKAAGPIEMDVKVHKEPVWRDQADHIIHGRVEHESPREIREQLWARKVADNRFVICCIPFFIYHLALGDEVETGIGAEFGIMQRVVQPSGRRTYWLWFNDADLPAAVRLKVHQKVLAIGCLAEWYSKELLAVDAASQAQADALLQALADEQRRGLVECVPNNLS